MRAPTLYDEVEGRARGIVEAGRPARMAAIEAVLVLMSFLLLAYLLFIAQFSGAVRWALGVVLIAAASAFAWQAVHRRTVAPAPLERPVAVVRPRAGELTSLTDTIRRAGQGLLYSQVLVAGRARDAFTDHARLALGLSAEGMHRLTADPGALRDAFRDPVLEDFVYMPTQDPDSRYRWVRNARRGQGFGPSLLHVLDRMEAWR